MIILERNNDKLIKYQRSSCIQFVNECLLTFEVSESNSIHRLLDSLVVECWHRVREVPGSILSQGPRHTKDIIKMVPVVPLFSTEH